MWDNNNYTPVLNVSGLRGSQPEYVHYILSVCSVVVVVADDHEYNLVRDLMRNYDMRIRPSRNSSESLNVTFGLALAQIIDVVSRHSRPSLSPFAGSLVSPGSNRFRHCVRYCDVYSFI